MSEIWLGFLVVLACGCAAPEGVSDSTIDSARIIAVIATPPEVAPGTTVHYQAVLAAPANTAVPMVSWSYCTTARSAGDNTSASPACVTTVERALTSMQLEADAPVPSDACTRFGSETPSGHAPIRADASGGYYQPLRVAPAEGEVAVFRQRIVCALPYAPLSAARDYAQHYVPNSAPHIQGVRVLADGVELDTRQLAQRDALTIELALGPGAQESYLFYDTHTGELTTKQEQLSASWFTDEGAFDAATTTVGGLTVQNQLLRAGKAVVELWIVVRDDRGGSVVHQQTLRFGAAAP